MNPFLDRMDRMDRIEKIILFILSNRLLAHVRSGRYSVQSMAAPHAVILV